MTRAYIPEVGQRVTMKEARKCYDWNVNGIEFEPGHEGVIAQTNVPAVRAPFVWVGTLKHYPYGRNPVFALIRFEHWKEPGRKQVVNAYYPEIIPIRDGVTAMDAYVRTLPRRLGILTLLPVENAVGLTARQVGAHLGVSGDTIEKWMKTLIAEGRAVRDGMYYTRKGRDL